MSEKKFSIAKATTDELAQYLEAQKALFREVNTRAVNAGRKAPYPDVDSVALRMEIVKRDGRFVTRDRNKPLEFVMDTSGNEKVVVGMSKTYAERVDVDHRRGAKYNDEAHMAGIIANDSASIEVGEITPIAGGF